MLHATRVLCRIRVVELAGSQEAQTNFPLLNYEQELENIERVSTEELVLSLRRQSKGFSRGTSKFRGVTRHQVRA